jgi:hypothetical protein
VLVYCWNKSKEAQRKSCRLKEKNDVIKRYGELRALTAMPRKLMALPKV